MTERKPPGISFTSWIDRQIDEAAKRGAFDNLPGAGRPLPKREEDSQAWLRDYLHREGVSAAELLPAPLKLRKEVERLTEEVQDLRSEQEVRDAAAELNRRILEWRRIPEGPPIYLRLVDTEMLVGTWRDWRRCALPVPPRVSPGTPQEERPRRRAWPRRRSLRRGRRPGSCR